MREEQNSKSLLADARWVDSTESGNLDAETQMRAPVSRQNILKRACMLWVLGHKYSLTTLPIITEFKWPILAT